MMDATTFRVRTGFLTNTSAPVKLATVPGVVPGAHDRPESAPRVGMVRRDGESQPAPAAPEKASPALMALRFRAWRAFREQGGDMTAEDLAEELDVPLTRLRRAIRGENWALALRVSALDLAQRGDKPPPEFSRMVKPGISEDD